MTHLRYSVNLVVSTRVTNHISELSNGIVSSKTFPTFLGSRIKVARKPSYFLLDPKGRRLIAFQNGSSKRRDHPRLVLRVCRSKKLLRENGGQPWMMSRLGHLLMKRIPQRTK
jgi:hypothetical protein